MSDDKCRLCGESTHIHFTEQVLDKYSCRYLLCGNCGSLQTEAPYWLQEAYGPSSIAASDSGVFLRGINNLSLIYVVSLILRMPKRSRILDFGGGNGLLCRMLRDIGFDARLSDQYARNEIARGFNDQGDKPDIMCSFEVAEHFPDPRAGMGAILGRGAAVCIVGTEVYRGQGKDWWYVSPRSGQHVFFYSDKAMKILADENAYIYERVGSMHFFLKNPLTRWQSSLLWRMISRGVLRWVRGYLTLCLTNRFADADSRMAMRASIDNPLGSA